MDESGTDEEESSGGGGKRMRKCPKETLAQKEEKEHEKTEK